MNHHVFERSVDLDVPVDQAFAWHARPGAFSRLTPGWENVRLIDAGRGITDGQRVVLRAKIGPVSKTWVALHHDYQLNRQFTDQQVTGPFAHWDHTHRFLPRDAQTCTLVDHIEYRLPLGGLGNALGKRAVENKLSRMFAYRHQVTRDDLAAHHRFQGTLPMKIAITGSTGLVGSALASMLTTGGHEVVRLVRSSPQTPEQAHWNPQTGELDASLQTGVDAVVHLAGESIAAGRWTQSLKRKIIESRVPTTRKLCETLANLPRKPRVLISASAIGYYGHRRDAVLTEQSEPGIGFLAELCRDWEAATQPARDAGIRVVNLRIGVVLASNGGALAKMLTPFKLGAGGVIGSGDQYMSWIALDDLVGAIHHALLTEAMFGPVNAVAPNCVTNREFTKTLGKVLHRPTIFPMPAFAARLALGEMADELLLASARIEPVQLLQHDYAFRFPQLEDALRHVLGRHE